MSPKDECCLPPWEANPCGLVSLLEMLKFAAEEFYRIGQLLARIETFSGLVKKEPDEVISKGQREVADEALVSVREHCAKISLRMSVKCCESLHEFMQKEISWRQLGGRVSELDRLIGWEMQEHTFMHIPTDRSERYGRDAAFGDEVASAFPSTAFDIVEAGNCYAAGRYTASVFHLMRVLELGLVAFAQEVEADQRENWQQLIEGIEKKLRESGKSHKSTEEKLRHEQHNQAASSFMIFKEAWRNYTAHARGKYTEEEADGIFRNVEAFMRQLAKTGLKEQGISRGASAGI